MAIVVRCDCGKQLKVKDELAGRRVKCPECGEVLIVPDIGEAVQATRPAPKAEPRRQQDEAEFDEDEEEERPRRRRRPEAELEDDDDEDRPKPRGRRGRRAGAGSSRLSRHDLYQVALYQKILLLCILCYLAAVVAQFAIPADLRLFVGLGLLGVAVVATVFVFLLATKVYSVGLGILMGVVTLIPCIGLIMLLVINGKATALLKDRGYEVGFLGASLSQFD